MIESIANLSLIILKQVENFSHSANGSFDAYWRDGELNTKKREAYKLEKTFHASMIALSRDGYWSQIQSVFWGKPFQKYKQVRKRANTLAIAVLF